MSLQSWQETLITSQVDGGAITAAAATSMLPAAAKFTLPANFFAIGKQLKITASGRVSTVVTTPGTMRFDVRFSGTVVFDSQAVALITANAYTNVGWWLEIWLTCRVIGTAANLMGQGRLEAMNIQGGSTAAAPQASATAQLPWNTAPAVGNNFDSTTTQQVDVFFTQTVATGSLTCHQYRLESIN